MCTRTPRLARWGKQSTEEARRRERQASKSSSRALYFLMIPGEHKEPGMQKLVGVGPEERAVGDHAGLGGCGEDGGDEAGPGRHVAIHPTSAEGACSRFALGRCSCLTVSHKKSRCGEAGCPKHTESSEAPCGRVHMSQLIAVAELSDRKAGEVRTRCVSCS